MYQLASSAVIVDCSRIQAFAYAADLENFGDWFPGVIAIVGQDELSFATVGKTYSETVAVPLRGNRQVLIQVVEVEASRRLVTEGDLPFLLPRMEIEFRDVGPDACEVRWRMCSRSDGALTRHLLLPVAGQLMRRRAERGLGRLKRHLEGKAP
ncbi:Uncharacterised protein [Mycolicibacterium vanbaalenii]|uniref:Polyketide cyclase / dehydrase and lipid transport n=1 Tax=Mycolicibacterium vanbaalenii TaxID=110539 RepID=A0A5S9QLW4_MYCVN|nr:SRPBCC family protein [Mycolicibacterium vanbaalenii]CAA0119961.1 Uncharacterised protein [Mycolicibacterium vanbaalenii]